MVAVREVTVGQLCPPLHRHEITAFPVLYKTTPTAPNKPPKRGDAPPREIHRTRYTRAGATEPEVVAAQHRTARLRTAERPERRAAHSYR